MHNTNELARLDELLSLNILDSQREERFDRFTRLVSKIFDVPVVTVTLVDEHRQWFKSAVGREERETPRAESVCSLALGHGYLEIADALEDDAFRDHPAVTGSLRLRFYAGAVLYGPSGQPIGTLCLIDVVPRKLSQEQRSWLESFARVVEHEINSDTRLDLQHRQIREATLRDIATGLPRESLLMDALDNLIRDAEAAGLELAVLHLRAENLDTIVRLHGRQAQDEILHKLVTRLTTPEERILAAGRTDMSRFVLVMPKASSQSAGEIAQRVVDKLSEPVAIGDSCIRVEVDAGVSVYPADGRDAKQLLERARIALRERTFAQRVHVFSQDGNAYAIRRNLIETRLEHALLEERLTVQFQPIYTADGGRITSFEALARWHDGELGIVGPGEFIPIAEKSDRLSHLLTRWVLRTACRHARSWRGVGNAKAPRVAVNIPAREFYDPRFVEMVSGILGDVHLDPSRLTLELTEESLIQDIGQATETMVQLAQLGIRLALDDFGTGYSSLSHLRRLPVNALKIDKSFIDDLPHQEEAVRLASGIIQIAHDLGLRVVAEGVEKEEQRALLEAFGCDMIQGYLLGRPMPASAISGLQQQEHK